MKRAQCGCWIKIFEDGTKEQGSDDDIQAGKASWSQGKLDDIKEVLLFDGFLTANLTVPNTNWYQFDRFVSPLSLGENHPIRVNRIIQAEIKPEHVGQFVVGSLISSNLLWAIVSNKSDDHNFIKEVTEDEVGKWLSICLPTNIEPFVKMSSKGKI